jgi:hypothetical protein
MSYRLALRGEEGKADQVGIYTFPLGAGLIFCMWFGLVGGLLALKGGWSLVPAAMLLGLALLSAVAVLKTLRHIASIESRMAPPAEESNSRKLRAI